MRRPGSALARIAACVVFARCLASCVPPPAQIIVLVDAEPAVRVHPRYEHVRVVVRGHDRRDGRTVERPVLLDLEVRPETPPEQTPWPFRLVLAPEGGDASRTYEVNVTGEDVNDVVLVQARAISGYAPGQTRVLYMRLTETCVGVLSCGTEETCRESSCEPARIAPEELPRLDDLRDVGVPTHEDAREHDVGRWNDAAGLDGGPGDVGADGARPPAEDARLPPDAGLPFMPEGVSTLAGRPDALFGSVVTVIADGSIYAGTEPLVGQVRAFGGGFGVPTTTAGSAREDLSVAVTTDGTLLAVGAPLDAEGSVSVVGGSTGSVGLRGADPMAGDRFGHAVAWSAAGGVLAVGAPGRTRGQGVVYLFRSSAGSWMRTRTIVASNPGDGDGFGTAVALNADGTVLAVAAPREPTAAGGVGAIADRGAPGAGAVYVFTDADSFTTPTFIKAPVPVLFGRFGSGVALDASGDTLVVGAPGTNTGGLMTAGAAFVYARVLGTWTLERELVASNAGADDRFGTAVDVSDSGNVVAVGAPLEDSAWSTSGVSTDFDEGSFNSGAIYVFERLASYRQTFLKPPDSAFGRAELGFSVAISGDGRTIVGGAPGYSSNDGAVLVFR